VTGDGEATDESADWYAAKLWHSSFVGGRGAGDGRSTLHDYSIVLVRATSEAAAARRAARVGKEREHGYRNEAGERVEWRFIKVLEVQDLVDESLEHGTEVWSRLSYDTPDDTPDVDSLE
jgi:hypothetical protein